MKFLDLVTQARSVLSTHGRDVELVTYEDYHSRRIAGEIDMTMHNPAHPGEILLDDVIKPLGMKVTQAAEYLGVGRKTLSEICNTKGAITPEMALRLELTFHRPAAAYWLCLQNTYDLWQISQHVDQIHADPIAA